jgi:hypothetical protein
MRTRIVKSYEMTIDAIVGFKQQGFRWVRRCEVPWERSLRSPTVGSLLEVTDRHVSGAVRIDSCDAVRLYVRLAV